MSSLRLVGTAGVLVLLTAWGCGSTTPTTPTPTYTQITENYTGALSPGEAAVFHFTVTNPGSIDTAITSLSPISTLTMGLNLGSYNAADGSCPQQLPNPAARLNTVLTGNPQSPGEYCVAIYDVGNLQQPTDFGLTVLHY